MPVDSFQYFSFITLTTVGYGDLTPGTELGQLLASLEALTGQLFLVSVVALVVGNLGRDLPHRRAAAGDGDPPDDE
jgi:voltage-gated potassium channel Kch